MCVRLLGVPKIHAVHGNRGRSLIGSCTQRVCRARAVLARPRDAVQPPGACRTEETWRVGAGGRAGRGEGQGGG